MIEQMVFLYKNLPATLMSPYNIWVYIGEMNQGKALVRYNKRPEGQTYCDVQWYKVL